MPKVKRFKSDKLRTLDQAMNSGGLDSWDNYIGDRSFKDWYLCAGHSRDSSILEESNYQRILEDLIADFGEDSIEIHSVNHWACGWIEEILIDPTNRALIERVEEIREDLESYCIYDEIDYYEKESEAKEECWENYGESDFKSELEKVFNIDFDLADKEDLSEKLIEFCFDYLGIVEEIENNSVYYYRMEEEIKELSEKDFFTWENGYFRGFKLPYERNGELFFEGEEIITLDNINPLYRREKGKIVECLQEDKYRVRLTCNTELILDAKEEEFRRIEDYD